MLDHQTHHAIDYIELSVLNLESAKQFFAAAFGWSFNDYGPEYVGIRRVGAAGECGGMYQADEISTGGPLVILYSRDLEASQRAVMNAGGTISVEIIAFPGGRRFQFKDPSGNEFGVWSDQAAPDQAATDQASE